MVAQAIVGRFTVLGPLFHRLLPSGGYICLSLHCEDSIEIVAQKFVLARDFRDASRKAKGNPGEWADFDK